MKKIKPSPLKQLDQNTQQKIQDHKGMTSAGMDILSEAARRKNWEEMQQMALNLEPEKMQARKLKDRILRDKQRESLNERAVIESAGVAGVGNSEKYRDSLFKKLKEIEDKLYYAIQSEDVQMQGVWKGKLASLKTGATRFREETQNFYRDHFGPDSFLSRSGSAQQVSYATQIYCNNPELVMAHASALDVSRGYLDAYGEPIIEDHCYAIVENFLGDFVFVNIISGNKGAFWVDANKAMQYIGFIETETNRAAQARKDKAVVKIDLGSINYKIDEFFGYNDGTATKKQDRLVLQFCWDDHLLRDGSNFRRHLYEHPNIKNLNHGGFDFSTMEFLADLGPGDKNYWHDNLDDIDRLQLVDAICNQDNPFFDIKLLRTLIKEYYIIRIENAWWKAMGYEEGRLEVMRLKQNSLKKERFKRDKAKAIEDGMKKFTFDGEVYSTGLTDAKIKKMEKEREEVVKKDSPNAGTANTILNK